jgi:transglutaminase-like putative cysteine protease
VTVSGRLPNYDDIEAVFSDSPIGVQDRYRVTGSESLATADELTIAGSNYPDWVRLRYLQLPDSLTAETVQLTIDIIASAGAETSFDKAWAIQEYLHSTYSYALNSEQTPSGRDAVDFFLFDKMVGRCEDYATAMVVMLRTQGIPARLVAGYRSGSEVDSFGDYLYREEQAHTWVEVFFPQFGWIPFEPTQGQAPFDYGGEPTELPAESTVEAVPVEEVPSPEAVPTVEATPVATPIASVVKPDDTKLSTRFSSGSGLVALIVVGGMTLVAVLFTLGWIWSFRGLRPGAGLYARVLRVGRLWGVPPHETMTPSEYAAEFGRTVPRANGPARFVADLYAAETYGGVEVSEEVRFRGGQAWRAVRRNVLAWRPWRRRK